MGKYIRGIFKCRLISFPLKEILFIISLILSYGAKINAAEITCTSGNSPDSENFDIATLKMTLSSFIPDYTELYLMRINTASGVYARCKSTPSMVNVVTGASVTNAMGPADTSRSGYIIFPTSVSGIGISINSLEAAGYPPVPAWPDIVAVKSTPANNMNTARTQEVDIRLWKIPGDIQTDISPFTLTGPTLIQGAMPGSAGDSMNPASMTADRAPSANFWTFSARSLMASAKYYVGTCNLRNNHQTVLLGKHLNFNRHSEWKDASFTIDCPTIAYGYGGTNYSSGNKKNKAPSIKIIPYNSVIVNDELGNTLSGTIALDNGGAQGYGVQLAWGDYSTQVTGGNPANPVKFETQISVATLVSTYPAQLPLNGPPPSATIKMAARFIQTEAIPQAGPARAAIEVIVNYE